MLEAVRLAIDSIPGALIAFAAPIALWANWAWASPYLRTSRHKITGFLAITSDLLLALAPLFGGHWIIALSLGGFFFCATFLLMIWPRSKKT